MGQSCFLLAKNKKNPAWFQSHDIKKWVKQILVHLLIMDKLILLFFVGDRLKSVLHL